MEFEVMPFGDFLDVGMVLLDTHGVVIEKNDFYLKNYEIEEFNFQKESFFHSSILSSEHKLKLEQDGKVSIDAVLISKAHTLSRSFPSKRLVDNKFLKLTIISLMNGPHKAGYVVVIIDRTEDFNNELTMKEGIRRWNYVSVLGRAAYFMYDLNTSKWHFSDSIAKLTGVDPFSLDIYLDSLLKNDKNMLIDQWGLSLSNSIQGDIFEYTYNKWINGESKYHSIRWTLDTSSVANPVVYGLIIDISELSKTESAYGDSLTQISLLVGQDEVILWKYLVSEDVFLIDYDVSSYNFIEELGFLRRTIHLSDVFDLISDVDIEYVMKEYVRMCSGEISSINLQTDVKNQNDNCIFVSTNVVIQKTDTKGDAVLLMGLTKKVPTHKENDSLGANKKKKMEVNQKTILVAEDIDNNYDLLNIILRKDYKLVRAVNGVEAVRLFSTVKPDIILMDMKMPEMGGLEATKLIRMESQNVPIIAVTAFAFESDREVAIEAGCNDFLSKPIDIPVLKNLIKHYLS